MIFFGESSLRRAVAEFVLHYHTERNPQGLGNKIIQPEFAEFPEIGTIRSRQRLGALLRYSIITEKPHDLASFELLDRTRVAWECAGDVRRCRYCKLGCRRKSVGTERSEQGSAWKFGVAGAESFPADAFPDTEESEDCVQFSSPTGDIGSGFYNA